MFGKPPEPKPQLQQPPPTIADAGVSKGAQSALRRPANSSLITSGTPTAPTAGKTLLGQ